MNNVETELKELILKRYGSLSEFCKKIDLPWTTLDSILKRGVEKANIKNILKITAELGIDVERRVGRDRTIQDVRQVEARELMYRFLDSMSATLIAGGLRYEYYGRTD